MRKKSPKSIEINLINRIIVLVIVILIAIVIVNVSNCDSQSIYISSYYIKMRYLFYLYVLTEIVLSLKINNKNNNKQTFLYNNNKNVIDFVQNEGPVIRFTVPKYNTRIHIVGCIHGSPTSSSYVEKVMNEVNPNAVIVELCEKRYKSLKEDKEIIDNNQIIETNHEKEILSINNVGFLVYCLSILTYSQRTLKIIPGGEFITAMREAEKRKIPILMGDEEVEKIISSLKNVGNIKHSDWYLREFFLHRQFSWCLQLLSCNSLTKYE